MLDTGKGSVASCITNPSMTWVKMRGRTLAVCRSMKLGATLLVVICVTTADDLSIASHDQSATPGELWARSEPAGPDADTSETGFIGRGSGDLTASVSGSVWLPDLFGLEAFCSVGQASTDSSCVCVDAAAITTADADAGRADVTAGCVNAAPCCRGDASIHKQQASRH